MSRGSGMAKTRRHTSRKTKSQHDFGLFTTMMLGRLGYPADHPYTLQYTKGDMK